ncbi:MAG: hypothetical protein ACR2HA_06975 [Nocardioides sp.]
MRQWNRTPWGPFSDVMVETSAGHRVLLAPTAGVADFIGSTYTFDEVRIEPVTVAESPTDWTVTAPSLALGIGIGRRTTLGRLLHVLPARLVTEPVWASAADPISRVVMRGVRTRGSADGGRREWYGATDVHEVLWLTGTFDGADLGGLAPVDPPCRFGFSSTPRSPSVTDLVTTVDLSPS